VASIGMDMVRNREIADVQQKSNYYFRTAIIVAELSMIISLYVIVI